MLEKYCTSMFWMDFKTFSPKPISCNFRRTTVPKLWKGNSKNENKNWNQGFFTEMRLKYFSQESCQSIAFLWKDSKISFEKKGSVGKKFDQVSHCRPTFGAEMSGSQGCKMLQISSIHPRKNILQKSGKIHVLHIKLILGWGLIWFERYARVTRLKNVNWSNIHLCWKIGVKNLCKKIV